MENLQHPPGNQNQDPNTTHAITQPQPVMSASDFNKGRKKNRKYAVFAIILMFIIVFGGGAAYTWFVYIPNMPQSVLKKAVATYASSGGSYTITGRLDQAGPNDPDFDFSIKTNAQNNSLAVVSASTFLQNPSISTQKINSKTYVKFSNFEDSKKLATHYKNLGSKGIQERIAEFTDKSNLSANQDQWLEINDYILNQTVADKVDNIKPTNLDGAALPSIGKKEIVNGKSTRKYEVTLSSDAFKQLVTQIDKATNGPVLSSIFPQDGLVEQIKINVWVNLKTKTIEQINYEGRLFRDATLNLKVVASDSNSFDVLKAEKLTSKLGYGIVTSQIFNKQFQRGDSESDKERIADLKGIKTALEIYKARTGHYPDRYEMSVTQESFISSQMPGADFEVFKDPNGRFIGRSGSQYAYVPALNNDSQECSGYSKFCEKYFIITTLDNGKEYQLNSD